MKVSKIENFEVLVNSLRAFAPEAPFDARLLAVRPAPGKVVASGAKHISASSSGAIDLLAHIVAMALGKASRPYR